MVRAIRRVACAVSGGVDSAVAALLLKRKGYDVTGFYMRNWDIRDEQGVCPSESDVESASWVCKTLQIPFHQVDFVKEYWINVFSEMVQDYEGGLTPNPDVLCNRHIKFKAFYEYARQRAGADAVATGHYARLSNAEFPTVAPSESVRLLRGVDRVKDQTLFLSQVSQRALRRTIFPLGEYTKDVVRKIACSAGMERIAASKESMGICFIGKRQFRDFMAQYVDPRPGKFIDLDSGQVVGSHNGLHLYTVGQRCGLPGRCYYIAEKMVDTGDITVVSDHHHPALYTTTLRTEQPHWIHSAPEQLITDGEFHCSFRFQHTREPIPCVVTPCVDHPWHGPSARSHLYVSLDRPQRAITAGQYAVFYHGDECLGSARILRPGPSFHALNVGRLQDTTNSNGSST